MLPTNRPPTHPGEMIREEFMRPLGLTLGALATRLGKRRPQDVEPLVAGRRALTAEMALRLARAFDTTPEFWMNLQAACDLWHAQRKLAAEDAQGLPAATRAKLEAAGWRVGTSDEFLGLTPGEVRTVTRRVGRKLAVRTTTTKAPAKRRLTAGAR